MNFKNIILGSLVCVQILSLSSCTRDIEAKQLFDKTPSERISERQQELKDALVESTFGWKCVYFTDKEQLGGFTHLFKFTKDNKVTMVSDFDDDVTPVTSEYDVPLGSMVSLLFTTKNRIHLLSDSNSYPTSSLRGKGYKGDFQFLYISKTDNEITFKGNRNGVEIKFIKATQGDWDNITRNPLIAEKFNGDETKPLFRKIEFKNGNDIQNVDLDFDNFSRYLYLTAVNPNQLSVDNTGIAFTEKGIVFANPVKFANQEFSEFNYDQASDSFVSEGKNNVTATIKYSNAPLLLTDDYLEFVPGKATKIIAFINANLRVAPTNSSIFLNLLNNIKVSLPGTNPSVNRITLYTNDSGFHYIGYSFVGGEPTVFHNVTVVKDDVNKKIKLVSGTWESLTGATIQRPAYLAAIDNILTHPDGLYVKKESFKIQYSNTIYTLTSAAMPFRMTLYNL